MRVALYPGSFDPITVGHVDIVHRGLTVFDKIIVAIAVNPRKKPTFSEAERVEMLKETFAGQNVEIASFTGLLVDYCRSRGIKTVLRGLRAVQDFEYEFQMASMNRRLTDEVDYIFMMTSEEHYFISSSLVREVGLNGGKIRGLVPDPALKRMIERFNLSEPVPE